MKSQTQFPTFCKSSKGFSPALLFLVTEKQNLNFKKKLLHLRGRPSETEGLPLLVHSLRLQQRGLCQG